MFATMMKIAPKRTMPWIAAGRRSGSSRRRTARRRDVEDRLGEDRAAEQDPEVEPGERDDRRERGAQAVAQTTRRS